MLHAERCARLEGRTAVWELAESFCATATQRIEQALAEFSGGHDRPLAGIGMHAVKGYYPTLSDGIIRRRLEDYRPRKSSSEPIESPAAPGVSTKAHG